MNIKHFILFTTSFTLSIAIKAQTFLGLQHSNFGGIHQAGLNPANIANSRHKIYVNGLTTGFNFSNDYLQLSLPFPFMNIVTNSVPNQYLNAQGQIKFDESWLKENVNGKAKNMNLSLSTRVPGFMMTLPKGFALGIQYKNTLSFQINDVAEPLARLARYGIDSSKGSVSYSGPLQFQIGQTFGDNSFTINMNAFGEIAGTIAKTIVDDNNFIIKAGFTPKLLMGYATGYVKNRGLIIKAAGTDTIVFGETDVEYGYTDLGDFGNINTINANIVTSKIQGSGFGYDIGASFEYKNKLSEKTSNKSNYLFRGGISLLDGGRITYKNKLKNTHITNSSGDKTLVLTDAFTDAWKNNTEMGVRYTDSVMRTLFSIDTTAKSIQSNMPSTLNLQFDYNIFKMFFVGANFSQDLRGKKSIGMRKQSYFMLIPRIESRFIEIALPMGMMNDYRNPRLGMYVRVGPVFMGSENLIGQLKGKNIYGLDFYFGISTGITRNKDKKEKSDS